MQVASGRGLSNDQWQEQDLWRAVDQHGNMLDLLAQSPRDKRAAKKFFSAGHAQRFLSAFGPISGHFSSGRHRLPAREYHATMQCRFQI
jgi:DDE domain